MDNQNNANRSEGVGFYLEQVEFLIKAYLYNQPEGRRDVLDNTLEIRRAIRDSKEELSRALDRNKSLEDTAAYLTRENQALRETMREQEEQLKRYEGLIKMMQAAALNDYEEQREIITQAELSLSDLYRDIAYSLQASYERDGTRRRKDNNQLAHNEREVGSLRERLNATGLRLKEIKADLEGHTCRKPPESRPLDQVTDTYKTYQERVDEVVNPLSVHCDKCLALKAPFEPCRSCAAAVFPACMFCGNQEGHYNYCSAYGKGQAPSPGNSYALGVDAANPPASLEDINKLIDEVTEKEPNGKYKRAASFYDSPEVFRSKALSPIADLFGIPVRESSFLPEDCLGIFDGKTLTINKLIPLDFSRRERERLAMLRLHKTREKMIDRLVKQIVKEAYRVTAEEASGRQANCLLGKCKE